MESIFGPVPINPVNIEYSLINENWPRFDIISDVNFTVNSPLVPWILSSVDVKPTGVLKLFCDHLNLTWDHVNNVPSLPLTSITKGPQYAVTRQFVNSIRADMNFSHCPSPYCFLDQIVTSCLGLLINGPCFNYAHTEIGGGASFALLNKGIKNWCAFTSSTGTRWPLWTLLPLPQRIYRTDAARSPRTWGAVFTIYYSASRRFDLYSPPSYSRRFNFRHRFTDNFIRMGRPQYIKSSRHSSNAGWVYFWCASW